MDYLILVFAVNYGLSQEDCPAIEEDILVQKTATHLHLQQVARIKSDR